MKDALKLYTKTKKFKLVVKLTAACAVLAMTVYTLIPKDEKIKGVTETGFLNSECGIRNAELREGAVQK